jgi:hypothetical protein
LRYQRTSHSALRRISITTTEEITMRHFYRYAALAVLALAVVVFSIVAFAPNAKAAEGPTCSPLQEVAEQIKRTGLPQDKVTAKKDVAFTIAYLGALGIGVPNGSNPVGIVFVDFGDRVVFGIVEPELCIKFANQVSPEKHKAALEAATKGV